MEKRPELEEIKKEPVTVLLILINTLIFLVVEFTGGSENGQHMLECGAAYAPLILGQGQWYRMFSSMFLHFGAPHLINNMLVLFVLGHTISDWQIRSWKLPHKPLLLRPVHVLHG